MKKILRKYKIIIAAILRKLTKRLFPLLIFLLLADLGLCIFLFTEYYWKKEEPETSVLQPLQINKPLMEVFSQEWARREKVFQAVGMKQYPDIFEENIKQAATTSLSNGAEFTSE